MRKKEKGGSTRTAKHMVDTLPQTPPKEEDNKDTTVLPLGQARELGTMRFQRAIAGLGLPCSALLLANEIHAIYSVKAECYTSISTLASRIGVSRRTIQRGLQRLQKAGIIKIVERLGQTKLIFINLFEGLKSFFKPSPMSSNNQPQQNHNEKTFKLNGRIFTQSEISNYINSKADKHAKYPWKFKKKLWSLAYAGQLSMVDFEQFQIVGNKQGLASTAKVKKETASAADDQASFFSKLRAAIQQDGRPLNILEEMAKNAKSSFQPGPLGGPAHPELSAIRALLRGGAA